MGACASCFGLSLSCDPDASQEASWGADETSPLLRDRPAHYGRDEALDSHWINSETTALQRNTSLGNRKKVATLIPDLPPTCDDEHDTDETEGRLKSVRTMDQYIGRQSGGKEFETPEPLAQVKNKVNADSAYGTGTDTDISFLVDSQQQSQHPKDGAPQTAFASHVQELTPRSAELTLSYQVQQYAKRPPIRSDTFTPPKTSDGDVLEHVYADDRDGDIVELGKGERSAKEAAK